MIISVLRRSVVMLILGCAAVQASTYYVSTSGSDSNPGSVAAPWRTIQKAANAAKAGDLVLVAPGDYPEYVQAGAAAGTAAAPIIFRASPANDPTQPVKLRAFRLTSPYTVLEGFTLTAASDAHKPWGATWGASIRIESAASNCTITNNTIKDAAYVIASDVTFDASTNAITSPSSDFRQAGFVPCSHIYLGACGLPLYAYSNHNTKR